jgi:N-methylhydantoinase B
MKTNLMRTAYNMIIYEALDFTVGLFDARGNILSIGLGLPMFIRGISDTIKAMVQHFGPTGVDPDDILLTNDAYITGSHLNHITVAVPIFHEGRVIGFSGCMAHWQDIGGTLGGITTDIYAEGLQIPIVKAYRAGVANEELLAIIRMNVRLPDGAMGDLRAQVASIRMGKRRFEEMIQKYGCEESLAAIDAILDQSEAVARARVLEIPDGIYEAESFMDDDGISTHKRIPIHVRVEIAGDQMKVDLTELAKQVLGFFNSGETAGRSCCQVAFKCLTSPLDMPINEGQFRALEILLPPGSVVSAVRPAAMRMWMTYPMTIIDTIFKALAPAIPNRVISGHHADLVIGRVHGRRPADESFYIYIGGLIGGGWGAKHDSDGMSATVAINDGDTHNGPSEQVEAKYPLLVERYCLRQDTGGPGRFRGGLGTEQIVQARHEIRFNAQIERVNCPPWGLFRGLAGAGNGVAIHRFGNEQEERFPNGKAFNYVLRAGDAYILRSGGGGGFGSPLDRDASRVEYDVRQGYVSRKAAEDMYGITFTQRDSQEVDVGATQHRRHELRLQGLPIDKPDVQPDAITKDDGHRHQDDLDHLSNDERLVLSMRGRCC